MVRCIPIRLATMRAMGLGLMLASGCGGSSAAPDQVTTTSQLAAAVRVQGVPVSQAERMLHESFPFFSVSANRLVVNDEIVYVFEYDNQSVAR